MGKLDDFLPVAPQALCDISPGLLYSANGVHQSAIHIKQRCVHDEFCKAPLSYAIVLPSQPRIVHLGCICLTSNSQTAQGPTSCQLCVARKLTDAGDALIFRCALLSRHVATVNQGV